MKYYISLLSILLTTSVFAAEVDSFTHRENYFEDISPIINSFSKNALKKSIDKTNSQTHNCNSKKSEKILYKELTHYFSNHSKGELVKYLLHSDEVHRVITPLKDSVYGSWSRFDGLRLGGKGAAQREFPISPLVLVGDRKIGIDKLEHMFGMGQIYFKAHYLKERKLRRVLKNGIFREKLFLGGQMFATGVFSYGDLAANFNGMRFWNHMLLKNDDVLGKKYNQGPYIKCVDNQFVINNEVELDFTNYVDASYDETINCPKFARKTAAKKFKKAIRKLGMTCPMSKESLEELKKKYSAITPRDSKKRPISHWILNTDKVEDVSYYNEF